MACSFLSLKSFGFYLCGKVTSTVYSAKPSDMQDLQQRIVNGCGMIRRKPEIFQEVRKILCRCTTSHVEAQSGHFERFLILRGP
jgi:hypothetical protein